MPLTSRCTTPKNKKGSTMQIKQLLSDIAIGMIGGYVGTKVMEPVSMKLYELEPEADRQPGGPGAERPLLTRIASRKTAALLGLRLTHNHRERARLSLHSASVIHAPPLSP